MTEKHTISTASPTAPDPASTIAVAMSGGVDSSAVAALLQSQGLPLVGLTLQLWDQRRLSGKEGIPEQVTGRCCSLDDVYDARRVAEQLGIPYYVVNQQRRFEQDVVQPFVSEYLAGRTPIPGPPICCSSTSECPRSTESRCCGGSNRTPSCGSFR